MLEEEQSAPHCDPDLEAKAWLNKLAEVRRKRSSFQDMAAEGLLAFDELREKLAALEETREVAERELEELGRHRERKERFERDKDALLEHYADIAPEAVDTASSETRRQVYEMLRLRVMPQADGTIELNGEYVNVNGEYVNGSDLSEPQEQPQHVVRRVRAADR